MKSFTVVQHRRGRETKFEGTMEELHKTFSYTLDCGRSWEHEKGNKKINCFPKGIKSLVKNLNNAVTNSAQNGYSENSYTVGI
jgi:hypothetical protein